MNIWHVASAALRCVIPACRRGETVAIDDVDTDPRFTAAEREQHMPAARHTSASTAWLTARLRATSASSSTTTWTVCPPWPAAFSGAISSAAARQTS
jgi:hypothetical protein